MVIAGYYVLIVVGLFLILAGVNWYLTKQKQVRLGMARPDFPYFKYTQEELNKLYPQYPLEYVKTTQTPEQTYAKFIAALKAGDLEGARSFFTEKNSEKYFFEFSKRKKEGSLNVIVTDLDKKLEQKESLDTFAQYKFIGEDVNYVVEFVKNINGVWKIDSL